MPPQYRPFEYWESPGAFNGGLFGGAAALFFSGTGSSGLDIFSLGTRESDVAPDQVRPGLLVLFWTLTTVRVFNTVAAGIEVPLTDLRLLDRTVDGGVSASPLMISIAAHAAAPVVLAVLRICSVLVRLSTTFSAVFGASRALFALAEHKQAPVLFASQDSRGQPVRALLILASLTLLGYLGLSELAETFLIYAVDAAGFPVVFIHLTIFVSHVRFRKGLRQQKRKMSGIGYRCFTGLPGSCFGIVFGITLICSQLWTGLAPTDCSLALSVKIIGISFAPYIYLPILLCLYTGYKVRCRSRWRKSAEMDYTVPQ